MTTALSNLIENAKNHGFKDQKKYRVNFRVALSEDKKEIIIEYKNDGRGFPRNFSFQDFISYGQYAGDSGNTGIGGYLIHQIIENHDGSLVYKEKTERHDPFNVQFEIVLPCRKNIKKNNE
jgi:type I restriction enzyme M protein